uniref:Si:ch211-215k15.4 n=1 Tax=Sinocyclocheilus rhinocerous TaxID=307959 RepID=A0A673MQS3_9TELE
PRSGKAPFDSSALEPCRLTTHASENVALKGKATQISLYGNSFASNAIDGNKDGDYSHGSCSHTANNLNPWWRLDLLKRHKVFSVVITNRADSVPERLNGAEIRIGNSLDNNGNNNPRCAVISSIPPGFSTTFECHGMEGRYINVVIPGWEEYLTLCEVEFFIQNYEFTWNPCIDLGENVALKGKATQISLYGNSFASNAIDGNKDGDYSHGSCSHTANNLNPWWRLDLLKRHKVFSVVITNRADSVPERLNGAEIRIGNSLDNNGNNNPRCAVISSIPPGFSTTFECHGMEGLYGSPLD